MLAYVLALQAVLIAWTAISPTLAGLPIQSSLCGDHGGGSGPSDQAPGGCPCGAVCLGGACTSCAAAPPIQASVAIVWVERPLVRQPAPDLVIGPQHDLFDPRQARAPPAMA
jgi:hypothetical protein